MPRTVPIEHEHRPQFNVCASTLGDGQKLRVIAEMRCAVCHKRLPATTQLELLVLQLLVANVNLKLQLLREQRSRNR